MREEYPNDDLFEGTKMTFGQHLEELRKVLFRSMFWLVLTVIIGCWVGEWVVEWVKRPLERALNRYYEAKAVKDLKAKAEGLTPEMENAIRARHIAPEPLDVELDSLIESLRNYDPERFAGLVAARHRFVADDVKKDQTANLAKALLSGEDAEKGRNRRVYRLLADGSREKLRRIANSKEIELAESDRWALAEALNELTGVRGLHEAEEFEDLSFLDQHGWLADGSSGLKTAAEGLRKSLKDKFAEDDSRRLNKLLLAAQFSAQLRPPQTNLVRVMSYKPIVIHVQTLSAQEAFMIYMKASIITALVLGAPFVLWEIWRFVAAGLYPHEKRYVWVYLPISVGLFMAGAGLAFFFVFDAVLEFFFTFNASMKIDPDPRISEWLSFVLTLPLGFGGGFQLPLVMLFLHRIGIFDIKTYISSWRIAIMAILVISMLLTPADPFSMMLMAIPLGLLYIVGIAMCKWMPRGRNPFAQAYEP